MGTCWWDQVLNCILSVPEKQGNSSPVTQDVPFFLSHYIQCPLCSQRFAEAPRQRDMEFCGKQAIGHAAISIRQALVSKHSHTCLVLEADLLNCNLWASKGLY